jgi:hypothetical protein
MFLVFSLQNYLHEGSSLLRHTYIACLVLIVMWLRFCVEGGFGALFHEFFPRSLYHLQLTICYFA